MRKHLTDEERVEFEFILLAAGAMDANIKIVDVIADAAKHGYTRQQVWTQLRKMNFPRRKKGRVPGTVLGKIKRKTPMKKYNITDEDRKRRSDWMKKLVQMQRDERKVT